MSCDFDASLAMLKTFGGKRLGVECAVFLTDIACCAYYGTWGKDDNVCYRDGKFWLPATLDDLCRYYPFWTNSQMRRIIARCKDGGYLFTGNYNDDARDRTTWFAVSDDVLSILGLGK